METVIYERTALSECTNQTIHIGYLEVPNLNPFLTLQRLNLLLLLKILLESLLLAMEVLIKIGIS